MKNIGTVRGISLITIDALQFMYRRKPLYHDFSLHMQQKGVYGLLGCNGSGKSTLLKLLSGLLFAQSGTVKVMGYAAEKRHPNMLANLYFVPEEFHLPNITLTQLVRTQAAFYPSFSTQDFLEYADIFELSHKVRFDSMSLGQKKKSIIAFALATHTSVLLMDEPTNGLDIISRAQFKTLMMRPEQHQKIVIISTHQARDLETLMDHFIYVHQGKLVLSTSTTRLIECLMMGVATHEHLPEALIYHEAIGRQYLYIAKRDQALEMNNEDAMLNLELLYKALIYNESAVLSALALTVGASEHV